MAQEEHTYQGAAPEQPDDSIDQDTTRISRESRYLTGDGTSRLTAHTRAPRRRTQSERRSEAEARLLTAAIDLVARKGWVGMTLAEVGEAAGYSRGQAAHYFGSKGALLRALSSHLYQSFGDEMRAATPAPAGLQAVLSYVRVYFNRSDPKWTNARTILLLLSEALLENSDTAQVVAEYHREIFGWIKDNLRLGIERGEVRPDVDPQLGAEFVVGAVRGLAQQRLLNGPVENIRGITEQVAQLIENSLASTKHRNRDK